MPKRFILKCYTSFVARVRSRYLSRLRVLVFLAVKFSRYASA